MKLLEFRYQNPVGKLARDVGEAHIFSEYSPASLMVQNSCDLLTTHQAMKHNDIRNIMGYLNLAD
jgi:hypothetical protein